MSASLTEHHEMRQSMRTDCQVSPITICDATVYSGDKRSPFFALSCFGADGTLSAADDNSLAFSPDVLEPQFC